MSCIIYLEQIFPTLYHVDFFKGKVVSKEFYTSLEHFTGLSLICFLFVFFLFLKDNRSCIPISDDMIISNSSRTTLLCNNSDVVAYE